MKKVIFLCCFLGFFFVTGCGNKKLEGYNTIDYSEYVKLMEDNKTFSLVIGSSTCSACSMYKGTMEKFIEKYQVDVKYIDISKLSEEEYGLLKSEINFSSTPTTIFIREGKHTSSYDRIVGAEMISKVVSTYRRMGFID